MQELILEFLPGEHRQMKILILANNDVGLYKFRKELIESFINQKHEVYISLPEGEFITSLEKLGCKYIRTEFDRRGINPLKDLKLVAFYWKIIKQINPDVILTYTIKPNIYGGIICRLMHIPYLTNITGLGTAIENKSILSHILMFMYKLAIKKSDNVFFQNAENKKYFEEKKVVKDNRNTLLIPGSGVNLNEHVYEEYPQDDGTIRFLFVGRIMKDKGVGELLECAKQIQKKQLNVRFDILGDFDEEIYRNTIQELEQKGVLSYYGHQTDVHSFIKSHHATILPSYHEGLSNVLLETAATGRPILASNISGCKETFEEGISGIGFEAKDSESLIRAVERFIELPYDEKRNMGICGRKKMEKDFDRTIVIEAYGKQIDKIKEKKNNV